ncbi:MAG: BrnT family toxin [Betaproteobacteria bacterium]|nr:BrnT family toxin [Betaproteobacteria bacterium]
MQTRLIWDEAKRERNLAKHGLDFADARWVLDSRYRLDVEVLRGDELRVQSFSYVADVLAVLTVVHTARDGAARIISFRPASGEEREAYHEWLESE